MKLAILRFVHINPVDRDLSSVIALSGVMSMFHFKVKLVALNLDEQ